jgi:hypothetical protein
VNIHQSKPYISPVPWSWGRVQYTSLSKVLPH